MPKALAGLTKDKMKVAEHTAELLSKYKGGLTVLRSGSSEHKLAKERMLHLLVEEQEKVAKALIRKAKAGDVRAITEFFDRLYGKAKETVDFNANVQFSLKALAEARREIGAKAIEIIDAEKVGNNDIIDV